MKSRTFIFALLTSFSLSFLTAQSTYVEEDYEQLQQTEQELIGMRMKAVEQKSQDEIAQESAQALHLQEKAQAEIAILHDEGLMHSQQIASLHKDQEKLVKVNQKLSRENAMLLSENKTLIMTTTFIDEDDEETIQANLAKTRTNENLIDRNEKLIEQYQESIQDLEENIEDSEDQIEKHEDMIDTCEGVIMSNYKIMGGE